jgi:hypothetical protein
MPNIKFSYLYRDGGNYKNYGYVVFANPDNLDLVEIRRIIHAKLIDQTWFYAHEWKVPDLNFDKWNIELDVTWHEFECIEYTNQEVDSLRDIQEFLN